jgi:hypothetical protein
MSEQLVIRRRSAHASPMRACRVGLALDAPGGAPAPAAEFPGIPDHEAADRRSALAGGLVSAVLHASMLGLLLLAAWVTPQIEEEVIPLQLIKDEPEPEIEQEVVVPEPDNQPAPAPKALAERRAATFAPQAQALAPQIVNPTVVARAAPAVSAERIEMNQVAAVVAPKQITQTSVTVERTAAIQSVVAAQASKVDLGSAAAPALRGPVDAAQPVGPSVGPRQVVTTGNTVGTGSAVSLGDSSSVREGIASDRDVLGSLDGKPLANVNTRVGDGFMRGDGGAGSGAYEKDCLERPEVESYIQAMRKRVYARWVVPGDVTGSRKVQLRIRLEAGGSLLSVENMAARDELLGNSAMEALRAASPFPPMSGPTRCLSQRNLVTTWSTLEN